MVTPRDLAVATWVTRKSLIASVGETVLVPSLCLDPINMNSVSMNSQGGLDETKLAQNTFSGKAFLLRGSTGNLSRS